VLEVAFSESEEQVKQDMAWWLNGSKGEVLMAISMDIKRPSGNIYITTWEPEAMAMATRRHPSPEPIISQEIKIYRGQNGRPPEVRPSPNSSLVIPFHSMMLRKPVGQSEGDFVFTGEDLLEIAERVWRAMDRM
jgi:hypothetical protein